MAERFGLGVVGAGMAAKPHFRSLADLEGLIEVRGVFTRSAETRARVAAETGFPAAASLDALIEDPKVDALLVMTPPDSRAEIVARATSAGKSLLVEKPLERDAAAAARIVEVAEKAGAPLGVIFQNRFRRAATALRETLDAGDLGPILSVVLDVPWWRPQSYYDQPGRGTRARDGGGVLITQAIHALDLMLWMTGPAAEAQAMAGTTRHRMETEDFAAGAVRFASGALGSVMATTSAYPGGPDVLTLHCRNAVARLANGTLRIERLEGGVEEIGEEAVSGFGADPMAFPHDWHRAQIAEFVEAVRAGRPPLSNGRSALDVHRLIDAMLRSSETGRRAPV